MLTIIGKLKLFQRGFSVGTGKVSLDMYIGRHSYTNFTYTDLTQPPLAANSEASSVIVKVVRSIDIYFLATRHQQQPHQACLNQQIIFLSRTTNVTRLLDVLHFYTNLYFVFFLPSFLIYQWGHKKIGSKDVVGTTSKRNSLNQGTSKSNCHL